MGYLLFPGVQCLSFESYKEILVLYSPTGAGSVAGKQSPHLVTSFQIVGKASTGVGLPLGQSPGVALTLRRF